jgi:two-component system, LytTR family, response regulator
MENVKIDSHLFIPLKSGIIIKQSSIIYCKASGSYTRIYFNDRECFITSRRLNAIQGILNKNEFFRCHRSYLVNTSFINEFCSARKTIILQNGEEISVSFRKIKLFKSFLEKKQERSSQKKFW